MKSLLTIDKHTFISMIPHIYKLLDTYPQIQLGLGTDSSSSRTQKDQKQREKAFKELQSGQSISSQDYLTSRGITL